MPADLPDVLNVLVLQGGREVVERIEAAATGRLDVVDLTGEVDGEGREVLLRGAHVLYLGLPADKTLPTRTPTLLWAHFAFAGVSNLMGTSWWGLEGPIITTSRGYTAALPIAETTIGAALMFAKRLNLAVTYDAEARDRELFAGMTLVSGKTMGIVGLGGIGSHVARLSRALGMRVVATRRSAETRQRDVDGVDELFPAAEQNAMLAEADFVAVCAMWTPETEGMIDEGAFAAMKPGAVLINIARGEIVDEPALVAALASGRLSGAFLDVWHGQLRGAAPVEALRSAPNVVFTPHVSGRSDVSHHFSLEVFVENLQRLLDGEPLQNEVDWSRGY
jgi:phosphoglycerate dehydrogenase-like enzyme